MFVNCLKKKLVEKNLYRLNFLAFREIGFSSSIYLA